MRTQITARDDEDDVRLTLDDDGPHYYGVDVKVREPFGNKEIYLCMDKQVLLAWCNKVRRHLLDQGYQALRPSEDADMRGLAIEVTHSQERAKLVAPQ
jgi:hypothetical protein